MQHAAVDCVSRQPHPESACGGRFRLRGVGARVLHPVAAEDPPCVFRVEPAERTGGDHEECGEPGGDEIDDVVRFGGGASERQILFVLVAEHRVHRIDRFIEEPARRAEEKGPEEGRDLPVRGVLRHGLDGSPADAPLVEDIRVPSDDHGDRGPRAFRVAFFEGVLHLFAFPEELTRREDLPAHDRVHGKIRRGVQTPCQREHEGRDPGGDQRHKHDRQSAASHIVRVAVAAAELAVEKRDPLADPDDGMGDRIRISDEEIDEESREDGRGLDQKPFLHVCRPPASVTTVTGFCAVIM